jgi:hypothetical protein
MAANTNNQTPPAQAPEWEPGPPRARNLGWDDEAGAWRFLHLETGEEFHTDIFALTPGHYEIAGKVYPRG